jgi:hypothetical protein
VSYEDCSDQLGAGTFCMSEPECWGGVHNYADSLLMAPKADCDEIHFYQTFAAGKLDFQPLHQSDVEVPQVRKVCNRKVLNKMLSEADRKSDWDIEILPPQQLGEMFYRCIFGNSERVGPIELSRPK